MLRVEGTACQANYRGFTRRVALLKWATGSVSAFPETCEEPAVSGTRRIIGHWGCRRQFDGTPSAWAKPVARDLGPFRNRDLESLDEPVDFLAEARENLVVAEGPE